MRTYVNGLGQSSRGQRVLIGIRSILLKTKIAAIDRVEARRDRLAAAAGPSVEERQAELIEFYDQYEQFVELLCDSAQYGPTVRMESEYSRLHSLLAPKYSELRMLLGAFLPPNEADAFRFASGRPLDAFEQLLSAEDLRSFLNNDDGEVIYRINCTRGALNLYAEHLRQLAARAA